MKISYENKVQLRRNGLSLIEVLIALTMTLIVLIAMMQAFKFASGEMAKGRASVELTNKLRTIEDLLRADLRSLTVDVRPHYNSSSSPKGYFEIVDGKAVDVNYIPTQTGGVANPANVNRSIVNLAMGDYDDIVSGTIRTSTTPFRGRNGNIVEESSLAEVVWFTIPNDLDGDAFIDANERVNLYRRVLLVKPSLGKLFPSGTGTITGRNAARTALNLYLQSNDISAHLQQTTAANEFIIVANSLDSLTFRENRFFAAAQGQVAAAVYRTQLGLRRAVDQQDLIMTDVAAFDVQVFDPEEPVGRTTFVGGEPLAFASGTGLNSIAGALSLSTLTAETGYVIENAGGAFVDLGKGTGDGPLGRRPFGYAPFGISPRRNFVDVYYDTGTPAYESNNRDDDGDGLIDEGRDGIDNGGGGFDELPAAFDANGNGIIQAGEVNNGEAEVPSPYTVPIRGLRVLVRGIEPVTKQVSQVTVTESLVAE